MTDIQARSIGAGGRLPISHVAHRESTRKQSAIGYSQEMVASLPAAMDGRVVGSTGGNGLPPGGSLSVGEGLPAASASAAVTDGVETGTAPEADAGYSDPVQRAVMRLDDYVQSLQRELRFIVDAESGRGVVEIADPDTGEVLRQIPSEVALRLVRNLKLYRQDVAAAAGAQAAGEGAGQGGGELLHFSTRV